MADNRPKSRWESVVEKVLCKAITTGNIIPFGLLVIGTIIAWRLPTADLKEVILVLVNKAWFRFGGWVLFAVSIYGCKRLLTWRDSIHRDQINRLTDVKNTAVQAHFELPLPPAPKKPE